MTESETDTHGGDQHDPEAHGPSVLVGAAAAMFIAGADKLVANVLPYSEPVPFWLWFSGVAVFTALAYRAFNAERRQNRQEATA